MWPAVYGVKHTEWRMEQCEKEHPAQRPEQGGGHVHLHDAVHSCPPGASALPRSTTAQRIALWFLFTVGCCVQTLVSCFFYLFIVIEIIEVISIHIFTQADRISLSVFTSLDRSVSFKSMS